MLVDDTHAMMEEKEFKDLPEYSASLPTGTVIGKRWKRDMRWANKGWRMGEYIGHPDPKLIGIKWRTIIVT